MNPSSHLRRVLYVNVLGRGLFKAETELLRRPGIVSLSLKARINLGQVVRRAHIDKECFILEKDGIPAVGIMDAEELEDTWKYVIRRFRLKSERAPRSILPVGVGQRNSSCWNCAARESVRLDAGSEHDSRLFCPRHSPL